MLRFDATGLEMTGGSDAAVDAWNETVLNFLSHGRGTTAALAGLLAADPESTLGWCAKGLLTLLLARRELIGPARDALARAERSVAARGGTARELAYVAALRWSIEGSLTKAIAVLETILDDAPRDSLAMKLSHAMRFMLGDAHGMRASIERIVPRAGLDHPHLGYLFGCWAFALEETGAYRDAERAGRRAIERAPNDAWGLHAISHVHEMTGRAADGAAFLDAHARTFAHCNNFAYHVFWHLALFRLELGDVAGALRLYDERVRADKTDDFRDIANAASLLMRLEIAGVDIGERWGELGDIAERRVADRTLVFADLHYALALVGAGRGDAALALALDLGQLSGSGDQAGIAHDIGAPAAEALVAFRESRYAEAFNSLGSIRHKLKAIGGSHAQRDVFEQLLIESAVRAGLHDQAGALLRERLVRRGRSRFARERLERLPTPATLRLQARATRFGPRSR